MFWVISPHSGFAIRTKRNSNVTVQTASICSLNRSNVNVTWSIHFGHPSPLPPALCFHVSHRLRTKPSASINSSPSPDILCYSRGFGLKHSLPPRSLLFHRGETAKVSIDEECGRIGTKTPIADNKDSLLSGKRVPGRVVLDSSSKQLRPTIDNTHSLTSGNMSRHWPGRGHNYLTFPSNEDEASGRNQCVLSGFLLPRQLSNFQKLHWPMERLLHLWARCSVGNMGNNADILQLLENTVARS